MNMVMDGERPPLEKIPYDTPGQYVELMTACWEHEPHVRPHFKQVSVLILSLVNLIKSVLCYSEMAIMSYEVRDHLLFVIHAVFIIVSMNHLVGLSKLNFPSPQH